MGQPQSYRSLRIQNTSKNKHSHRLSDGSQPHGSSKTFFILYDPDLTIKIPVIDDNLTCG